MKPLAQYVGLFVVLPATALAHGTEVGGMSMGSVGSVAITAVGLAALPSKVGRKSMVFGSVVAAVVATWILMFAGVGDFIYFHIRQSIVPWILIGGLPPLIVGWAVYYFCCRPTSPHREKA